MWSDALRSVRPENSATPATARRTTTPAPVRGSVPAGAPGDFRVRGAAAWVPAALRGFGAVVVVEVFVVVGVVETGGGEALTRGTFSHGGHGAW